MSKELSIAEADDRRLVGRARTAWKNRAKDRCRCVFTVGPVDTGQFRDKQPVQAFFDVVVTWEPGETKELPSEWDGAIHRVYNGTIIGGAAPWHLVRADGSSPPCDPALAPSTAMPIRRGARPRMIQD